MNIALFIQIGAAAVIAFILYRNFRKYMDKVYEEEVKEDKKIIKINPEEKELKIFTARKMIFAESGIFTMGFTWDKENYDEEKFGQPSDDEFPPHSIKLDSFYIGKYPVTFEEFDLFCMDQRRSHPSDEGFGRGEKPVINVRWFTAVQYCNWLSEQHGLKPCYTIDKGKEDPNNMDNSNLTQMLDTSKLLNLKWNVICDFKADGYRLPTEAEWEYAARGGKNSREYVFSGSNDYDVSGWTRENSGNRLMKIRRKTSNELGIYDMSGNVNELCWDWYYDKYYESSPHENPKGPKTGSQRVIRGGCYASLITKSRVSSRGCIPPIQKNKYVGFRLVRKAK